jgi:hypothetical protein
LGDDFLVGELKRIFIVVVGFFVPHTRQRVPRRRSPPTAADLISIFDCRAKILSRKRTAPVQKVEIIVYLCSISYPCKSLRMLRFCKITMNGKYIT